MMSVAYSRVIYLQYILQIRLLLHVEKLSRPSLEVAEVSAVR